MQAKALIGSGSFRYRKQAAQGIEQPALQLQMHGIETTQGQEDAQASANRNGKTGASVQGVQTAAPPPPPESQSLVQKVVGEGGPLLGRRRRRSSRPSSGDSASRVCKQTTQC